MPLDASETTNGVTMSTNGFAENYIRDLRRKIFVEAFN